jgi:hypothetical protein
MSRDYWTGELLLEALREAMATGEYSLRFVREDGAEERSVYFAVPFGRRDPDGGMDFLRVDLDGNEGGEVVVVLVDDHFCDHGEGRVALGPVEAARAGELYGDMADVINL